MKKLKCTKCGIYYKDRQDEKDGCKDLCFKCNFIWKMFCGLVETLSCYEKLNRDVTICLDDLDIRKKGLGHTKLRKPTKC